VRQARPVALLVLGEHHIDQDIELDCIKLATC
jgi:hypothetical protein